MSEHKKMIIIRNAICCNKCGDVIRSLHLHDFKTCKCGSVSVYGGHQYLKRSLEKGPNDITDLSIIEYV